MLAQCALSYHIISPFHCLKDPVEMSDPIYAMENGCKPLLHRKLPKILQK